MKTSSAPRGSQAAHRESPPLRQPASAWAWHVFIALSVLILGMLLTVNPDGSVSMVFLPEHSLPMICLIRKRLQIDCLTCGMTRSVISLLHGHVEQSYAHHRLGWLALLVIVLQIPYGIQLRWRGENAWRPSTPLVVMFWIALFSALVAVRVGNG